MPAKDALASGAKSAVFSAGHAKKDDPITFNRTVAAAGLTQAAEVDVFDRRMAALDNKARAIDLKRYQPMNDRVLLRRIVEKSENLVNLSDAHQAPSNKAEVIAVGTGMMIGNSLVPIPLAPGDVVIFGEYGVDEIEVEGEKLLMISAFDVRLKIAP